MSWSTSELRVRLAPLNRFKPSSKIFYWPFQGGTSFVDLLCFCSVLCLQCFVRVCLYVLCGHLLGKGWPLGSRLWCLLCVCHFPIGILGQVWYLIVSIPDLCTITSFFENASHIFARFYNAIEKLLAGFNVQPRIGMNQSLIWLHYHVTLLMTSYDYIHHPAPYCTIKWSFLISFMFKLWCIWYHVTKRVYRLFLIKSN